MVHREVPVAEGGRSRKGLYFLDDNLFDFWFRFVYPNIELIETENTEQLLAKLTELQLNEYMGRHFERIIAEIIPKLFKDQYSKVGRWWDKGEEFDIIALNENKREILFCECKWSSNVDAEKLVKKMVFKSEYVKWHTEDRKESYSIFARSFKKRISKLGNFPVYCYDFQDIEKALVSH